MAADLCVIIILQRPTFAEITDELDALDFTKQQTERGEQPGPATPQLLKFGVTNVTNMKLDDHGAKLDRLLADKEKSSGHQRIRAKNLDHMDKASIDRRKFKIDTSALIGEGGFAKVFAGEYLGEVCTITRFPTLPSESLNHSVLTALRSESH